MKRHTKPSRPSLYGLNPDTFRESLDRHFEGRSQPGYRTGQVSTWVWERGARSFDEMTNLPAAERTALAEAFDLSPLTRAQESISRDGTVKHLWSLPDGELVESVLIPAGRRTTLCVSSQAGCAMGCTFCSTGWGGFRRQLTTAEIVAQYVESVEAASSDSREAGHQRGLHGDGRATGQP